MGVQDLIGKLDGVIGTRVGYAEDTIADVDASGLWPGKVVTEAAPPGRLWEAEPEHQDCLQRYPCYSVRPGWKLPRRAQEAARCVS